MVHAERTVEAGATRCSRGRRRRTLPPFARHGLALLFVLLGVSSAPLSAQDAGDPGFRAYLWVHGDRPRTAELLATLRELGFRGISAEPGTPATATEPGVRIPYYLDQVVRHGILHVPEATYFETIARDRSEEGWKVRPRCLREPDVLALAKADILQAASTRADDPPDFVSLRDEPSFTRGINPADWCQSFACRRGFSEFLQARWGTPERLRAGWGPGAAELLEGSGRAPGEWPPTIPPPSTAAARRRFHAPRRAPEALVPWSDAREFADQTFAGVLAELSTTARAAFPGVPVGFLGGQMPHVFGGYDWEELLRSARVVEPYDYGGARELVRSLAPPGTLVFHTLFAPPVAPELAAVHELYHYFLHRDAGVIVYSDRTVFMSSESLAPTPWIGALAPHLRRLRDGALDRYTRATPLPAEVAVLCSMPSLRLHWMLDSANDGESWIRRLTSHEAAHSTQARTREAWIAILEDLGLTYDFVTPTDLRSGILERYRALVLPRAIAMSPNEVRAVQRFNQAGGLVLADCQTALFGSNLREHATPPLDEAFGIERTTRELNLLGDGPGPWRFDAPYPVAEPGVRAKGAEADREYDGVPVLLVARPELHGEGRTLYLNLLVMDYVADRLRKPARAAWLLDRLRPCFLHAGIVPRVTIERAEGSAPWPVETFVAGAGDAFVVAFHINVRSSSVETPWRTVEEHPEVRFTARLWGSFTAHELLTGSDHPSSNLLHVTVRPEAPAVFELQR